MPFSQTLHSAVEGPWSSYLGDRTYQASPEMQIEKSFGGNICYPSRGSSACKAEWSHKLSLRGQAGTDSGTPNFIFHLRMVCWLAQTSQSFAAGKMGSGELIEEGLEGGLMGVGLLSSWLERLILRGCKERGHAKSYNKSYILCNRERQFHSWKENTQTREQRTLEVRPSACFCLFH